MLSEMIASISSSVKASVWSVVGGAIFVYVFSFWASLVLLIFELTLVTGFFRIFAIFVTFALFAVLAIFVIFGPFAIFAIFVIFVNPTPLPAVA